VTGLESTAPPRGAPLRARVRAALPPAAIALTVAVAYYVGSRVGFALTVPPMSPSLLWPPNAILAATLLLTPPRRWPLYLLAALPAHLAVQLGTLRPTALVLVLFLTNCSEAIIAATVVRHLTGGGPALFHSLRSVVIFIAGAGFLAPIVSSFWDAAAVTFLRGDEYWLVWRTRLFANALTALTLVPSLVIVAGRRWTWPGREARRRILEAAVLWLGLFVVGWSVFEEPTGTSDFDVLLIIPLAFIVPFLVWAAVRLGPTGTSLSLLTVELLAVWGGVAARGPFAVLPPAENVLSLQIVLIVLAIPLMCLAALIEERQRAQQALEGRLRFEEVLSRLSRAFVHLPSHDVDRTIEVWLRRLGEHLGVRHITIFQLSSAAKSFTPTHSWTTQPEPAPGLELPASAPDDGQHDVPLLITDSGVLSFGARVSGAPWSAAMIAQIRLVAEVFGNALARKQAEDALRLSEAMNAAILSSLTSSVAVLDQNGRVVAINEGWSPFLHERDGCVGSLGIGASYGDVCRLAIGADSPYAGAVLAGIRSVLDATEASFRLEWPSASASVEHWFEMAVLPLHRSEGGAVVSVADITRRKQVEIDAQQTRQELAHFTRVSAMGELAASLAHELNQPLAGILANAQAAQRFLAVPIPDLEEIRAILADIVADDRRAGEVIRRLREMLRKAAPTRVLLDLNVLIGDVAKLLSSDALIRGLSIVLDFDPKLPAVTGDRVELQQVVLNLLVNAMEAMAGPDAAGRIAVVRTACAEAGMVQVSVRDAGTGIATAASIFEPFYTTKAEGMGMGLSIARSIIEAHGGRIWAENNSTGGATFHFALAVTGQETA
jgi:signal transduction histidine kinase/integral membrane sensor domain MASE1